MRPIPINAYIGHLLNGGYGFPLHASGAIRYGRSLIKKREGSSAYKPHQGKRECERRRVGGFHTLKRRSST